jgi:hypothetical protein
VIRYFRHVPNHRVPEYQAKGWRIANDLKDCHHGHHAVLMIWEGEGEPG